MSAAGFWYNYNQHQLRFGPVLQNGAQPASALASCTLRVVDNVDAAAKLLEDDPLPGTVDSAATWTGHFDVAPGQYEGWPMSRTGTLYFYTIELTAADGTIVYLPTDADGNPDIGTIMVYDDTVGGPG